MKKSNREDAMKKILVTIMCAALLNISNPKPAVSGLIIDPASIAQNFGGTAQTIFDMAVQDILQNGMLKQLQTQGFSLASLKTLAMSNLGRYGVALLQGQLKNLLKPQVKSTKGKEEELLNQERDAYAAAAKANASEKLRIAEEEQAKTEELLAQKEKEAELHSGGDIDDYEIRDENGEVDLEKLEEAETRAAEFYKLQTDISELKGKIEQQKIIVNELKKEKDEIGTEKDPKFRNMNKRAEILQQEEEDAGIIIEPEIDDKKDWAQLENTDGFMIDADTYKKFIDSYFYELSVDAYTNPQKGEVLQTKQQELEAKKDKIVRQRKYLVINTAAHLLQVSATIRREKPMRESVIKKWFDEAKEQADELNATTAYSNTRIENSRALLLYAKLLAAKMQYNAAKEINGFELEKLGKVEGNNYSNLDLGKYALTKDELINAIKNSEMVKTIQGVLGAGLD